MSKLFNSLQFRLYVILVLLALLFAFLLVSSVQTTSSLFNTQQQLELASRQRSNAYLLVSQARRMVTFQDDATAQDSITTLLRDTITNTDQTNQVLRFGEDRVSPITQPEVLSILDTLETEWAGYRTLLEQFIAADAGTRPSLLPALDDKSVVFYTFADRVVRGLTVAQEQQIQSNRQTALLLTPFVLLTFLFSMWVIYQSARSIRELGLAAAAFTYGNFEARANMNTVTEIAIVAEVLNSMAESLNFTFEELSQRVIEAKEAQEKAERSDQVKSAFLASMSHELRTPLNSIINFTKFVAKGTVGDVNEEQQSLLNDVLDSAKHLLGLINDVLDMSKIESGSLKLFVEDNIILRPIVNSVISTGRNLLQDKPVTIETDVQEELPAVRGDRQRILQILLNIMSNACKFTETGKIIVSVHQHGEEVKFAIKDTGSGIALEDYVSVFESFKQTHTGLREGGGTGLGMPISKSLAEAHGGRLWLESEVGKGSTFYVAIPVKSEKLVPLNLTPEAVR